MTTAAPRLAPAVGGFALVSRACALTVAFLFAGSCGHAAAYRLPTLPTPPTSASAPPPAGERRVAERSAPAPRRGVETALHPDVMPIARRELPRLHSKARGSAAIGTVTEGFLTEPAEVAVVGPHHRVLARIVPRNTRFTTDEMKALLLCAAAKVAAKHDGQLLGVGNLSRGPGGDLPWSVSHNNGRDADIAFYAHTPAGAPALADHLYHFGRDLMAREAPQPLVFDVAANWTLVKSLIACEGAAPIDYLFAANWLQVAMLRYAAAAGEDKALLARAGALLHQPRRAAAHADHLHLRIGCPPDDLHEGCVEPSRAPDAAIGRVAQVRARLPKLRASLQHRDPVRRAAAAELLALYRDASAWSALQALLDDDDARVRSAAMAALLALDAARAQGPIAARLGVEPDARVAGGAMRALLERGSVAPLRRALEDGRVLVAEDAPPLIVRAFAATLLGHSDDVAHAPALAALLRDPEPAVRGAARAALEFLCNRATVDLALAAGTSDEAAAWATFAATVAGRDRTSVVLQGFEAGGVAVHGVGRGDVGRLAAALALPAPYVDNAALLLVRALRYDPGAGRGARATPLAFWLPWLARRSLIDGDAVAQIHAGRRDAAAAPAASALSTDGESVATP